MCILKVALIILSAGIFTPLAFSKPNPQLKEQKIKAQLEFVEHLIDRGEAKDALSMLKGLHQEYPEDSAILEVLSHFYFKSQQYPLAAFYLEKLYQANPSHTPSLLLAAQSYAYMQNYPAAIHNYTLYLQHHPQDAPIWKNLGLLQQEVDNVKAAAKAYLKAFHAEPSSLSGEDHLQVAQWFLELENQKRAREFLTYALKEKEARERALVQLIELDLREHKFSNARQKLAIVEGLNKNALTLYPIESLKLLIEEAEAAEAAQKQSLLSTQTASSSEASELAPEVPEPNPAAEAAWAELISSESPKAALDASHFHTPQEQTEANASLSAPFKKNLRLELSTAKPRALLAPLPMAKPLAEDESQGIAPSSEEILPSLDTASETPAIPLSASLVSEPLKESTACITPLASLPADPTVKEVPHSMLPLPPEANLNPAEDEKTLSPFTQTSNPPEDATLSDFDTPAEASSAVPDVSVPSCPTSPLGPVLTLDDSLQQGQILEQNAQYPEAIALYTQALEGYPQNAELLYHLSRAYFKDNQLPEAEKAAFSAMRHDPHSLAYTFHYLKIAQHTLAPEHFIHRLKKAKDRFPKVPELSLALARSYEYHLHDLNQALVFYKEFLEQAPAHPKRSEAEEAIQRLL